MEIKRATPADYAGILELQAANYRGNLTAKEREGGFLSAEFTPSQIAAMADGLGIMIARDGSRIAGYLCAHRADLAPLPPVVEAMLRCCRTVACGERALADARLFVYGPVCIDRTYRGRGLLRRLYGALAAEVTGTFEFGVTLVAQDNPRSLRVHVDGLGMKDVAQFEHGSERYHLLAFSV